MPFRAVIELNPHAHFRPAAVATCPSSESLFFFFGASGTLGGAFAEAFDARVLRLDIRGL